MPGRAWPLSTGLDYSVNAGGIPDLTSLWVGPPSVGNQQVAADIKLASAGKTVELGELLATHSIRYLVVVEAIAPDVPGLQQPRGDPPPSALLTALDSQIDLRQLPTQGGYEVFDNPEFVAPSSPAITRAPTGNGLAISGELVLWAVVITGLVVLRRRRSVGVPASSGWARRTLLRAQIACTRVTGVTDPGAASEERDSGESSVDLHRRLDRGERIC